MEQIRMISGRRNAVKALAAAAFGIAIEVPQVASGKKRSRKGKKNAAPKRCKAQVAPCRAQLEPLCQGLSGSELAECIDAVDTCCGAFGACDAKEAIACLILEFII